MGNNIVPVNDLHSRSYLDKNKVFIGTSIFKNTFNFINMYNLITLNFFLHNLRNSLLNWSTVPPPPLVLGGAQHYRDQGTSGPGVTAAVLNYITKLLIQGLCHAGTLYLNLKNALAPLFDLPSSFKKIQIEVSNVILCLFTAILLPNLIVVVIKTS